MEFFKSGDSWWVILSRLFVGSFFLLAGFSPHFDIVPFAGFETEYFSVFGLEPTGPASMFFDVSMILIGIAMINNLLVPTALLFVYPIVTFMIIANFMVAPWIGGLTLVAAIIPLGILTYFYRKVYTVFFRPQMYVNPMAEKTSDIIVVEEVREKAPSYFRLIQKIQAKLQNAS